MAKKTLIEYHFNKKRYSSFNYNTNQTLKKFIKQ